jgi:WD40 repeat protein
VRRLVVSDAVTGKEIQEFNNVYLENGQMIGHQGPAVALTLSPDERLVATGGFDSYVTLWEVETGQPIREMRHPQGKILSLAFSPDGAFLVGTSTDNIMRVWSAARDWKQVVQLPDFGGGWYGGAAFHPTKPILATGAQGGHAIHFWEYNTSAWR